MIKEDLGKGGSLLLQLCRSLDRITPHISAYQARTAPTRFDPNQTNYRSTKHQGVWSCSFGASL